MSDDTDIDSVLMTPMEEPAPVLRPLVSLIHPVNGQHQRLTREEAHAIVEAAFALVDDDC